ncbi:hypothetical protein [uncultured Gilvimarinus sp.]|uniref:hypothetical protein n=1 Tax=uncultured Gilvimarinus sp. TaxID=1689143 RepID=UPI0030EF6F2F|tara:strand:+ start:11646 stop:11933 length:288 start_codon:yes stop_codon:yes gene_type:complete
MVKPNSAVAYIDAKRSGKVASDRVKIIEYLSKYPGSTRHEVTRGVPGLPINVCCPRVNELIGIGAIEEIGNKKDSVTGGTCARLYVVVQDGDSAA